MSEPIVGLGSVAHIAFVVDDVRASMRNFVSAGIRWSSVRQPRAMLRAPVGEPTEVLVDYVVAAGGEPRLKLISRVPGSLFDGPPESHVHHLSYWVKDLDDVTSSLVTDGWRVEADGLGQDESVDYRYLVAHDGARIELGLERNRADFDAWADGEETS